MSQRSITKYISILKQKIKESLDVLSETDVNSEDLRKLIININNMEACVREYSEYLKMIKLEDTEEVNQ